MKYALIILGAIIMLSFGFFVLSCSNDNSAGIDNNGQLVEITQVTPADGSVNIPSDVSITLKFSAPVDTLSIMRNLHLAGGDVMHEWRDSLDHYGGFGMMNMGMRDHMTDWMDSIHTEGNFRWNASMDSCEFAPTSMLMNNTEYICLLEESGMRGMNGAKMGGSNHNDDGYHMFGFTTGPMQSSVPKLISTIPADGSSQVETGLGVTLVFNMPMDTQSVREGFHFAGGDEMHEWMDSLDHHMGMGGMGMMDMDHMMEWMDSIHNHGQFHWNSAKDSCLFIPDSMLMSNTEYMMYLTGDVHDQNNMRMDMDHLEYDGHMIHFMTRP